MADKIEFIAKQSLDAFCYNPRGLTVEEISLLDDLSDKPKWEWQDFPNATILCNYTDTVNSSSSEQVGATVIGYKVFKQDKRNQYEKLVADVKVDLNDTSDTYIINDRDTASNTVYEYQVYPYSNSSQGFEIPYKGVTENSSNDIVTAWNGFSLIPMIEIGLNQYGIWNNPTEEMPIWNFFIDAEEGSITQNQSKTVFPTFAKTPKVQSGRLNYLTGSLKCKLGDVDCNGQYYEPTKLVQLWESFIALNHTCLLKNPKGDSIIVSVDGDSSRTYFNNYANWSMNSDYEITNRPTEIQFNFTEIKKREDISIVTLYN